jgi:hypothetical protein
MNDDILHTYLAGDEAARRAGASAVMRSAAQCVVGALGEGPQLLIARTDAALMVCAATAMLRDGETSVTRAPVGRTGWEPPANAILVEVDRLAPGLRETLKARWPGLEIMVVPVEAPGAILAA